MKGLILNMFYYEKYFQKHFKMICFFDDYKYRHVFWSKMWLFPSKDMANITNENPHIFTVKT